MIRLLLLLCAGLFVTLQVGGQDRGQMRFGLMEAAEEAERVAAVAPAVVDEPASRVVPSETPLPDVQVTPAAFALTQPVVEPAQTVQPAAAASSDAVRYVTGRSVNVRSGPSTQDGVVGKLTRGEAVSVVWVEENGWARVRVEGDGIDGFMSMDFLSDTP